MRWPSACSPDHKAAHELLVHDDDALRTAVVAQREVASGRQRDLERRKVSGGDSIEWNVFPRRFSVDSRGQRPIPAGDGRVVREADRGDACLLADGAERVAKERRHPRVASGTNSVERSPRVEIEHQHAFVAKSRIDRFQVPKAPNEQARAYEQQQRQRDLQRDENLC
jgi:hypothetical protein